MPGSLNAITDVAGVTVGFETLIFGEGRLEVGKGPVRTGVSAILPRGTSDDPVFGGWYALNGNGEMTGTTWVEESGFVEGPIMITNTHSVGIVRDAVVEWRSRRHPLEAGDAGWLLPVVAETWDGFLNDANGHHVTKEHAFAALDRAQSGRSPRAMSAGGTGMMLHRFKGGTGTASRQRDAGAGDYTLGVLVQANYGAREELTIAGAAGGPRLPGPAAGARGAPTPAVRASWSWRRTRRSCRISSSAWRGGRRSGSAAPAASAPTPAATSSSLSRPPTPAPGAAAPIAHLEMLPDELMNPLLRATIEATEEAVINALIAAETMTGRDGHTAYAIPHDRLREVLRRHGRLIE